jgi:hypothetical protein
MAVLNRVRNRLKSLLASNSGMALLIEHSSKILYADPFSRIGLMSAFFYSEVVGSDEIKELILTPITLQSMI